MPKRKRTSESREKAGLTPETKRDIALVVCLACAAVTTLAFLGLVGPIGASLVSFLRLLVGRGAWLVPFWVFLGGILLTRRVADSEEEMIIALHRLNLVGLVLVVLSLSGILHLPLIGEKEILIERGGGYFGWLVVNPLNAVVGIWGSGILLVAFLLVGILVTLNTTLPRRVPLAHMIWTFFRSLGQGVQHLFDNFRLKAARSALQERGQDPIFATREVEESNNEMRREDEVEEKQPELPLLATPSRRRRRGSWSVPLDLLDPAHGEASTGDLKAMKLMIERTLASFGIPVEMGEVSVGPTVTQFTCRPAEGIKLSRIAGLTNDLALALAAHPIRIEAPIPGKSLVGIEVPNTRVAVVTLREVLENDAYKNRKGQLVVVLGKDVAGNVWVADLARMPHLLIAGATGSGKSVTLHALITSLLYQHASDELRFILVDPKRVELVGYNGIPHLMSPVITDVKATVNALKWTILEMDRRFDLLSRAGKRNIEEYNRNGGEPLPYLVFAIDELADLMTTAGAEVEAAIIRLAQMSRAVGIHLILATQRPSVDIITGLIKANITSRVAFAVASAIDSRTIIDTSGAEKLLGRGDMLYSSAELSKPRRLQGAFVSEEEVSRVVKYLKEHSGEVEYDTTITEKQNVSVSGGGGGVSVSEDDDPLLEDAKTVILEAGKASASLLQRRLKVGYARAARLLDLLEAQGFVGPGEGAKPREILVDAGTGERFDSQPEEEISSKEFV